MNIIPTTLINMVLGIFIGIIKLGGMKLDIITIIIMVTRTYFEKKIYVVVVFRISIQIDLTVFGVVVCKK